MQRLDMGLYLAQIVAGKIGLALTAQSEIGQGTIITDDLFN